MGPLVPGLNASETLATRYFQSRGLCVEKIPENDKRSADFWLRDHSRSVVACCEVKEFEIDDDYQELLEYGSCDPESMNFNKELLACRSDPAFNSSIFKKLTDATEQFRATNEKHLVPNIIFLMFTDDMKTEGDLRLVVGGAVTTDSGFVITHKKWIDTLTKKGFYDVVDLITCHREDMSFPTLQLLVSGGFESSLGRLAFYSRFERLRTGCN